MKKLFLALPFLALSLIAQDFRGSLVGTVTDAGGGRVRNAVIVLRAGGSSLERQAASDGRVHIGLASELCARGFFCGVAE